MPTSLGYSYNERDPIAQMTDGAATHMFGYNAMDQITSLNEIAHPGLGGATHAFSYDDLQRLTSEAHTNQPPQSFTYDQVGNRTNAPNGSTPSYTANNRLMSYNGMSFTYDLNGNRESQTSAVGTNVYSYDNENRLINVLLPDSTMIQYKYDALGRRVERSRNGGASWERYSYDRANVIKDTRSDGVTVEYGNGLWADDKLWQKTNTSSAQFFTVDHLGSTRALTDENGATINSWSYEGFGKDVANSSIRFGYAGREGDVETGLMYYRARFYDPVIGRFLSEDPVGLIGGINFYSYVSNDPLNSLDPSGLGEIDTHYYLTYYLVKKHPCFSEVDAKTIANADQGVDEDPATMPGFKNPYANEHYHALHSFSHTKYLKDLWSNMNQAGSRDIALSRFGVYLHYLQDTYNHSGFVNSWVGHGLLGHLPDKSASRPEKSLQSAFAVWDALNKFARERGFCGANMTQDMLLRIKIFIKIPGGNGWQENALSGIDSKGVNGVLDALMNGIMNGFYKTDPSYLYRKREILDIRPR
ncbi:MAG: hypothetical protein HOP19_05740 [Acidobacteria bacterium]|nr:hypothetical protein [Acidobacteriota bacterium]